MAKWGDKRWIINSKVINPLDAFSYSMSWDPDTKSKKQDTMTLPYTVYKEFGVNVKKEIHLLKSMIGEEHALYIGTERFGASNMVLVDVSMSDIQTTPAGTIRKVTFSLGFEQKGKTKKTKKGKKNKT